MISEHRIEPTEMGAWDTTISSIGVGAHNSTNDFNLNPGFKRTFWNWKILTQLHFRFWYGKGSMEKLLR